MSETNDFALNQSHFIQVPNPCTIALAGARRRFEVAVTEASKQPELQRGQVVLGWHISTPLLAGNFTTDLKKAQ